MSDSQNPSKSRKTSIRESRKEIEEALTYVRETKSEIDECKKGIDEIHDAFKEVKTQVEVQLGPIVKMAEDHKDALEQFVSDLNAKKEIFDDYNKEADKIIKDMRSNQSEAEKARGTAAVIGLGKSFNEKVESLSADLREMQIFYRWSLVFLFISVVLALILVGIIPTSLVDSKLDDTLQMFVRSTIASPAIILVIFTSKQYKKLFALKEQYAYKATMAFAVNGFQKQVGSLEYVVATAIFDHLMFNPIDKVVGRKNPEVETTNRHMQAEVWRAIKDTIEEESSTTYDEQQQGG